MQHSAAWAAEAGAVVWIKEFPKIGGASVPFAVASFGPAAAVLPPTTTVAAEPVLADAALTNAAGLAGMVAVVRRGGCQFHEKARWVQKAGAVAMVVVNAKDARAPNTEDAPLPLGDPNKAGGDITIPCICVGKADVERLLFSGGGPVAVQLQPEVPGIAGWRR